MERVLLCLQMGNNGNKQSLLQIVYLIRHQAPIKSIELSESASQRYRSMLYTPTLPHFDQLGFNSSQAIESEIASGLQGRAINEEFYELSIKRANLIDALLGG